MAEVTVTGIDHVVWIVADAHRSVEWYDRVLGLPAERLAEWEAGDAPFVSVRIDATTVIDLFEGERNGTNVDHVSLCVTADTDLARFAQRDDVEVVSGPMTIWGAQGTGTGLYIADPDGNTIELKSYA